MHQVRLATEADYRDYLHGDPSVPGAKVRILSRGQQEERLADLIVQWPGARRFLASLGEIDDAICRKQTADYRNLSCHSIGPRLGVGTTRAVVRSIIPATRMEAQADGTFQPTPVPGRVTVSYGFGGTSPLDLEQVRVANLEQYRRAHCCYHNYRLVLAEGIADMPAISRGATVAL